MTLESGQGEHSDEFTHAKRGGHLEQVVLPVDVATKPTAHWSQLCVSPFKNVPAGHGSAASTRFVSAGGAATTPVTALSTGSAEPRSAVVRDPASATVALSAERSDDACVAFAVATENATAAEACSRCRPESAALVTAVIAMMEAGALSVAASVAVSVLFCAAPKLPTDTPASVTVEANVVCVELAKPGGFTVHATAPGAGE